MADPNDTSENLDIRCPQCRQQFPVGAGLMDRMVECGACEFRFRINGDVIMRTKKFYPGERAGMESGRIQRVPSAAAFPEGMETMRYAEFKHPEQLEPASPQRILAGIFGVSLMLFIGLLLIFAINPGAMFSVMPLQNKLIVAGFSSLLGIVLLIYANPRARGKAAAVGILLGAGVISLPFFFTGQSFARYEVVDSKPGKVEPVIPSAGTDDFAELRGYFGTEPLEVEQERLLRAGSANSAYGIFLTDLMTRNKYTARDFLISDTGASPSSHPYPREDGNYLMVLTGVSMDIGEVAEIAGRLGKTEEIHEDIGVVVVSVDNSLFLAGPAEKLNNKADPAFYELNKYELGNIDPDRVKRAVERLSDAEPSIYRKDITIALIELMGKPGVAFHDTIAKALLVWAEEPDEAARAGLSVLRKSVASGDVVSENLVDLVTRGKPDDALPTIYLLWTQSPDTWEKFYGRFGESIIPGLMAQLTSDRAPLRRSAIRLLGEVGTEAVASELEKLSEDEDPEVRVLSQRAVTKIKER